MLIALLAPALAKARQQVKKVACQNNLRQFGFANNAYAFDNKGFLPVSDTNSRVWDYLLSEYVNYSFNNYNQRSDFSVFHCPSGVPNSGVSQYRSRGYGYNQCIANDTNNSAAMARIGDPSRLILMMDMAYGPFDSDMEGFVIFGTTNVGLVNCAAKGRYICYRHFNMTNVLFADAHVAACAKGPYLIFYGVIGWIPSGTKWVNSGPVY